MVAAVGMFAAGEALASGPMLTGALTSQPIGHYEFCKSNPSECSIRIRVTTPEHMSGALWSLIVDINGEVNELGRADERSRHLWPRRGLGLSG